MSGSSCARTGCPTECSNASTTSSAIAAMPGTHSSTSPGRSCLSQDAHGLASVRQSEDWYQSSELANLIDLQTRIMPQAGVDLPLIQLLNEGGCDITFNFNSANAAA